MTIPQVRGMYAGDRTRKQTLVDLWFSLAKRYGQPPLEFPRVR